MDLRVKTKVWFLMNSPCNKSTALTITRPLWGGHLTKPPLVCDRKQDVQENILAWLILPGQEQGSTAKFILLISSVRGPSCSHLLHKQVTKCYSSLFATACSQYLSLYLDYFYEAQWSLTPWKLRDHTYFRSTGVSRLISGSQNNYIVVISCTRSSSMSRFMLWYDIAGILDLNFQGKIS